MNPSGDQMNNHFVLAPAFFSGELFNHRINFQWKSDVGRISPFIHLSPQGCESILFYGRITFLFDEFYNFGKMLIAPGPTINCVIYSLNRYPQFQSKIGLGKTKVKKFLLQSNRLLFHERNITKISKQCQ